MKHSLGTTFLMLCLFSQNSVSQGISTPYEVGTWSGFRSAAISYTFDDNCTNQLALVVPMFDEFDFKLTLFTVINWSPDWTGLQNAVSHGHEIASHTMSHASLNSLSDSLQTIELKNSQRSIDAHITGQKCVTIAYPNCIVGNTSIVRQYYLAARGCSGSIESKTPGNFMNISSIICGSQGSITTSAHFKSTANTGATLGGWCVYLLHGIDNDGGYSPLPSDALKASLEYLKANPDKFWVTSFGNAAKYIRERNAASVSEISVKEDSIAITVSDTLDNSYYDCPITIRRPLPQSWASADVMQNGAAISSQVIEINSVKYLMFDVVPDHGDIALIKRNATGIEQQSTFSLPAFFELYQNYPNPFNPETKIEFSIPASPAGEPKTSIVRLKIFDLLGREVAVLVNDEKLAGRYSVVWDASAFSSGVYFYRLSAGSYVSTKKLILMK
jgi:peptidoglycan/xylan/chitin deacetylase (PgdA/CDA1 family)